MPKQWLKSAWIAALVAGLLALAACGKPGGEQAPPAAGSDQASASSTASASPAPATGAAKPAQDATPPATAAPAAQDSDSGADASPDMLDSPDGQPATMDEDAYLDQYRALQGVKTLPSGVMYFIKKSGHGKSPAAGDRVRLSYSGTLMDGTPFDETKPGETRDVAMSDLVQGLQDALLKMKEGDVWEVVIPSDLGYGDKGAPGVPPGSPLVFEVTLVKVLKSA